MASELVPMTVPATDDFGEAQGIQRVDTLEPGYYWQALEKVTVPQLREPQEELAAEEVSRETAQRQRAG